MATTMEPPNPESQPSNNSKVSAKVPGTKSAWSQVVRGIQVSSDSNAASDTSAPATPSSTYDVKKVSTSPADPTPSTEESMSPQPEVDVSPKPVKQAWKKPSTSPGDTPVGPVMGAVSWPALGDTSDHKSHEGQVDQVSTSPTESSESKGAARRLNLQTDTAAANERPVRYNGDSPRPSTGGSRPYYQQGGYQGNRRNTREQGRNNWNSRNYVNNQGGMPNRMGLRHYPPQATTTYVNVNPGYISPAGPPTGMYYMQAPAGAAPMHGATGYYGAQLLVPIPDPATLKQMLLQQIEYYFSVDNLCRDVYLRRQMDDQGYVPVGVIASFNRVRSLTMDKNMILDALRDSAVVEVEGDKLRTRHDWDKWPLNFNGATYAQETDAPLALSIDNRVDTISDSSHQRVGVAGELKSKIGGLTTAFGSMPRPSVDDDEELDGYSHDHGDEDDVQDHDVQRLIIVTQSSGGQWQDGIPDDIANAINDGLYFYEQQLNGESASVESNGAEANGLPKVHSMGDHQRLFETAVRSRHIVAESPPNPVGFLFGSTPSSNIARPSASSLGASSANASVGSPPVGSVPKPFPRFQHPSHALLEKNGFKHQKYLKFYNRCLAERKRLGVGKSEEMNSLFRFWSYFLRNKYNSAMYKHFRSLAEEDFEAGVCYGMQCLFRFYSYGLERKFKQALYDDFEQLVMYTYKRGNLYGLEKYWAFHFYRKAQPPVKKHPQLERLLTEEYRTLEDFHKASHGNEALMNGNGSVDDLHLTTSRPTTMSTVPATSTTSASIAVS